MTDAPTEGKPSLPLGFAVGDKLGGRYEIVGLLGAGGMGAVFEATHTTIGKQVAIKVLKPAVARDPQLSPRFLQEARAANEVRHKNIVQILDFGIDGDRHYMVMEYLHGEPLTALIDREDWLQPGRIIRIMDPILKALAFAHQRGIVHRDIKPDNLFLAIEEGEDEPTPKILDFGIAKRSGADLRLTKGETGLGTPSYMAPEQVTNARDVTNAADQYAVGVILYEALSGRKPHEADSYEEMVIAKVTTSPAALSSRHPGLDPKLCEIVMRAISTAPGNRFESIPALREALHPFRSLLNSPPPPGAVKKNVDGDDTSGRAPTVPSGSVRAPAPIVVKTKTEEVWTSAKPISAGDQAHSRTSPRRWPLFALGVVLVGAAIGVFRYTNAPRAAQVAATSTSIQQAATPLPATTPVVFRIHVEPQSAEILLDGVSIAHGMAEIMRPRDSQRHRLVLTAPGYETADEELTADQDVRISRVLSPIAAQAPTAPPAVAPTLAAPVDRPHERTRRPPTRSTEGSEPRHYGGIDRDNPF